MEKLLLITADNFLYRHFKPQRTEIIGTINTL